MKQKRPVVGLTGNIGSGKSTVAEFFAERGCVIIDGDILGKQVVEQSQNFRNWLRNRYGESIFDGDALNRAKLGRIVFSDEVASTDLNKAIWPYIRDLITENINKVFAENRIPVVDAAMIFEWNDSERYDLLVSVVVDPAVGVKRAAARMNLSESELMDRYKKQVPWETKAERSDIVIVNDGSLDDLIVRFNQAWKEKIFPFIEGFN